ncbi:hypothetical protein CRUP_026786 [Coryphaenoides rupestris]|nr:hypothetical protein CRUP_026786 [Coryphaenoides rupestris]
MALPLQELRQDAELQEGNLGWLRTRMAALIEAEKMVLAVGDCVQFREEVRATLEEVVDGQKEAQVEALRILDSPTVRDAQQLLLGRQQLLKRLKQRRRDVQQLTTRGQQLQAEEGLEFDSQQEAVREFVSRARAATDRDLNFSSPESLAAELSQARVLLDWHIHLDKSLPGPLGVMGAWLHRAEIALREEIPIHQAHEETANGVHRKLEQHKEVLKNLESHRQTFQQIHRDRSVNGVPVPSEQLQDMAER